MERSDWSEDDPLAFQPPLPPDDRLWRHPSEVARSGGSTFGQDEPTQRIDLVPTLAPPGSGGGRRRAAMALAAGTAGALLVVGLADIALRSTGSTESAVATTFPLTRVTTAAVVAPLGAGDEPSPTSNSPTIGSPTSAGNVSASTVSPAPTRPTPVGTGSEPSNPSPVGTGAVSSSPRSTATTLALGTTPNGLLRIMASTAQGQRAASAIALDDHGTLVTSMAAIRDADAITVLLPDGTAANVVVLGIDGESGTAVLAVDAPTIPALTGRAALLEAGSAVATPWPARSTGTVKEMGIRASANSGETMRHLVALDLPTATAMGEGEALLDEAGAVVGLCTHDAKGAVVAVPIELARAVARSLRSLGRIAVPWLGIGGRDAQDHRGALVQSVDDGGPAATGGLQAGDVIVAVAGQPVGSMTSLVLALRDHDPGQVITLTVTRGGDTVELAVTASEKPLTEG